MRRSTKFSPEVRERLIRHDAIIAFFNEMLAIAKKKHWLSGDIGRALQMVWTPPTSGLVTLRSADEASRLTAWSAKVAVAFNHLIGGPEMNAVINAVGTAKNVMKLHWVEVETGEIHRKKLCRGKFLQLFAQMQPACGAMEACGGSHHWARTLTHMGHTLRENRHGLIASAMVTPADSYAEREASQGLDHDDKKPD